MMEVPSTEWVAVTAKPEAAAPLIAEWRALPGIVRHVFTHFELTLSVWSGRVRGKGDPKLGVWVTPDKFGDYALPSVMMKVARHALKMN
jgi:A/G-specific adenine glycosylase